MAKTESGRTKFIIDKTGFFAEGAIILLLLASIFRVIGGWNLWNRSMEAIMLVVLPVVCCLLMCACLLLFGKKCFFLSSVPVLLGVVFLFFQLLSMENILMMILCIILYILIAILYPATVVGWLHTKWFLPPLFAVPLLYRIAVDLPRLSDTVNPVTFAEGMMEMSILCMTAAMLFVSLGLKKFKPEPAEPAVEGWITPPTGGTPAEEPEPEPQPQPEPEAEPAPEPEPAPEAEPVWNPGLTLEPETENEQESEYEQ